MEFYLRIWEAIRPHLAGVGLLVTWFGIALVAWKRRRDWKSKRFAGVVNFSLNYIVDNKLILRSFCFPYSPLRLGDLTMEAS